MVKVYGQSSGLRVAQGSSYKGFTYSKLDCGFGRTSFCVLWRCFGLGRTAWLNSDVPERRRVGKRTRCIVCAVHVASKVNADPGACGCHLKLSNDQTTDVFADSICGDVEIPGMTARTSFAMLMRSPDWLKGFHAVWLRYFRLATCHCIVNPTWRMRKLQLKICRTVENCVRRRVHVLGLQQHSYASGCILARCRIRA